MYTTYFVLFSVACAITLCEAKYLHSISDEFINLINNEGKWKAGRNFPPDTPLEDLKRLGGAYIDMAALENIPVKNHDPAVFASLPESFDPRDKWPYCPTLNEIRDQGRCGSCWAFGAVSAMTDRVCIHSNGTKHFHFSAEDLVTCNGADFGCDGGTSVEAFVVWKKNGIVSGGNYNSHEGCKPYSFPECANHLKNCTNFLPTPPCKKVCDKGYPYEYNEDKKRGKDIYYLQGEEPIMADLYTNGPVEATFLVYEDFANYKSGVYEHVHGDLIFGHAVKLMGWGVEDGKKYWLAANSWGEGFGENGFFKILRGEDHCSIERFIMAGDPLLKDY